MLGREIFTSFSAFVLIRVCSQDIFKTIKGTKSSIEGIKYSLSDIPERYFSDGKNVRGNFNEQRHDGFSA